jgi:cholesterol transport system auxiliary component
MRRLTKTLLVAVLMIPLGACISLFPKSKPSQLYRFGAEPAQSVQTRAGAAFGVLKSPTTFVQAGASDRILTVTQGQAAYIKEARWVSPAEVLFDEAVARAFQGTGGRARLITRGEVVKADYVLKLDVRSFETRYGYPEAVPEVVVETRALLTRSDDLSVVAERVFTASVPAGANRVGSIVAAYDQATGQVISELYAWVNSAGR